MAYQRKFEGKSLKVYDVCVSSPTMDDEYYEVEAASMSDAVLAGYILSYHNGEVPSTDSSRPNQVFASRKEAHKNVVAVLRGQA